MIETRRHDSLESRSSIFAPSRDVNETMMIQSKVILQDYNKSNLKKIVVNGSSMVLEMLDSFEKLSASGQGTVREKLVAELVADSSVFQPHGRRWRKWVRDHAIVLA